MPGKPARGKAGADPSKAPVVAIARRARGRGDSAIIGAFAAPTPLATGTCGFRSTRDEASVG